MAILGCPQTSSPEPSTTSTALPGPARRAQDSSGASVSRLILGPLTETTWTQPASCSLAFAGCSTCNIGWQAQACVGKSSIDDDQACWPPTTQGVPKTRQALNGWGMYSPGLACPSGYTSAAESTYGNNAFQFPLTAGETAIGCCPEPADGGAAFFITTGGAGSQTCIQQATTGAMTLATCQSKGVLALATSTLPITAGQSPQLATMSAYFIYAPMFQIVHHSSDVPGFSSSDTTTTTTTTTTGASSNVTTSQSGLPPGVYAGIGVSAAFAIIILAFAAFLLWRRQQKSHDYQSTPTDGLDAAPSGKEVYYQGSSEPAAFDPPTAATWGQHDAPSYYSELSGGSAPSELHSLSTRPAASPPVEMPAGSFYDTLEYSRPL